ncbi:YqgE/AlgH family protein [Motiliproteus sediminis]|uniref:YqgE/AlgH family protein n=1 Tax=Motiliproteus sediminis TaxID=1468178 RepID=UPI001FE37C6E|nr:YqgE/AlgH family protein [Motiliproteus sediminis]
MHADLPDMNLRDHFLISMPHLADQNFVHTLTYICDHSEQGAMGLVINRPMALTLEEILGHLEFDTQGLRDRQAPVYAGGPVQTERGFVLHSPTDQCWNSSFSIHDQLCLTTSLDVLRAIAGGGGPKHHLIALGYAGWGAGQLEREIGENSWLSCPADLDIIFATQAEERLGAAASKLGVDLSLLSSETGHA